MTESDFKTYQDIKARIDVLEEELYALFEAKGEAINPIKRIIKVIASTKNKQYQHNCEIKLSLMDIRALQDNRQIELDALRKILKDE